MRFSNRFAILVAGLIVLGLWQVVFTANLFSSTWLASPSAVAEEWLRIAADGSLWINLFQTLTEVALAFLLATGVGLGVGFLFGVVRVLGDSLDPFVFLGFSVPKIIWFPFLVFLVGVGVESKIVFGSLYGFFPIVISIMVALKETQPSTVKAARSMGASPIQIYSKIVIPSVAPVIFTGLRIGFILTLTGVLVGEMLVASAGVGLEIMEAATITNPAAILAYVITIGLIAISINESLLLIQGQINGALHVSKS